jgi:hypothetical protein
LPNFTEWTLTKLVPVIVIRVPPHEASWANDNRLTLGRPTGDPAAVAD